MCPSYDEGMSKVIDARYDAKENVFRLVEKPVDIPDDAEVTLSAMVKPRAEEPERPWFALRGALSEEDGAELAALTPTIAVSIPLKDSPSFIGSDRLGV